MHKPIKNGSRTTFWTDRRSRPSHRKRSGTLVDVPSAVNRGVDPVLKVRGGGGGGPIYIHIYVCIIYIYIYI